MGLILDTSVFVAAERGRLRFESVLGAVPEDGQAGIAAITVSELLEGVEYANTPERRQRRIDSVDWVLSRFAVHPFGIAEARVHARLRAELASKGRPIGAHDLLIAATCLRLGVGVATLNLEEFRRVPGLAVDDWTAHLK